MTPIGNRNFQNFSKLLPIVSAQPFVWGGDGSKKTPEQLDRERRLAQAMIDRGIDFSPVGHWTQGAARMMSALAGNIKQARADNAEKAGIEGAAKKFAGLDLGSLLSGGAAYPSAVAGGASPTSGAATGTTPTTGATVDLSGDKQKFIDTLLPAAIEHGQRIGVDPRIIVAQAAQETGWGRSAPGNNFFGIKSHGQGGGQNLTTHEVINGQRVKINDSFRTFASPQDSVAGYADFIASNKRYRPMREAQGLDAQLQALGASGYATDPNYARSVGAIARSINLPQQAQPQGVQVASLDPSIGMAQAYAPEPQPQTAAAAINQIAPQQPVPEAKISDALLRQNDMALGGALAPQGQAPQQVADTSGYFPAAPSADSAPIMGSYAAPRQGGVNIQRLLEAASDPWMNDAQRSVIGMALQQQMQQNDPMRALQAQKLQLEMDALRAKPQTEYGFTTLPDGTVLRTDKRSGNAEPIYSAGQKPTSDMQEYNFAVSQGFKGSFADYQQAMKKAGASSTNVSVGEGDKFYEALDKKNADTFAALSDAGIQARSKLAQIERLGGLMQASPTGATAVLKLAAGEYGIKTDGLDDLQAAQALINELVPQQRQPGSGPMSDADLALFKQSLPRIINTPDGNQLILDTMRGITQYQIQMGDIADQVANREISAAEGRNRIKNLKNPLEGFRTSTKDKTLGKSGVSGNRLRFNPQTGDFE
ncbi:flagellar biosynthesis protein FlgJ [Brucella abortus]|uniref:Glucosaminidase domain-containing protein n=1 Tax=Brucella abortus TaxID=235 RepID=A0AAE9IMK1_BRUAO|nr:MULTISPECIES: glycoside hydrolase family 73 protein [Brucella]ALF28921.1 flagellar rod assembly protein FlgJ [Brucella abortus 104M]ASZ85317.1 flagellar biosynthesis protein FlgJ [Brucella abortus]ASZ88881.1 flagellar biosynthesis protein FlgJ [Brucella abortus]ASZ91190.1 flagellar biosynthesis protein FlgJ [Brucella abortus]ASZ97069.1 flagellar biosynthesis protein FlgJ [Brucella abortus]